MSKIRTRHNPDIHAPRPVREEYVLCRGDRCRNAIAVWARQLVCSRCRGRKKRRR